MADSDKIRVLIVDDIAETRENLRKLLQFEKDVEVIGVARSGREAIEQSRETKPDVVLMDINMPDMDGITATEMIRRNNTITQIVILSVQGDPNYMRRAMLAGARDFLTKPPAIDELTGAIRRAGKMARDERIKMGVRLPSGGDGGGATAPSLASQGKIITVYSPKGGVGVTTLAVNLAMSLRNEDTFVALVDGDLQFGDVAVFLNEQSKTSVVDLGARSEELDPEFVDEVMITHAASGVKILTAPDRPEHAESITGEQFARVLKYLRQMFAYIVIDTDSALNDITLSALDCSDLVILLTSQEIPAIKNCRLFLDLANALQIDRRRILFVMNRFDKRIGITPEKVGESFKQPIAVVLPFDERVVIPSVNRGIPFMLGDRSKPISRGFLSLAEAIRQRLVELSTISESAVANDGKKLGKR
jgi:pilus assembly protein CpaE